MSKISDDQASITEDVEACAHEKYSADIHEKNGRFINDVKDALSKDEVKNFFERGYVIKKDLFSKAEVAKIATYQNTMFATAQQIAINYIAKQQEEGKPYSDIKLKFRCDYPGAGGSSASIVATQSENKHALPAIKLISWIGGVEPELLEPGRQCKIMVPVAQLLGSNKVDHLINQAHYKMPHDKVTFNWHQDIQNRRAFDPKWEDVNKQGSFVQVLTAIDEATLENGPLVVVPNSHVKDLYLDKTVLTEKELQQKCDLTKAIPLMLEPGDTVFMHPMLLHKSDVNESEQSRKMFINGFSYPGANKQLYPGLGSAAEISCNATQELISETHDFILGIIGNNVSAIE